MDLINLNKDRKNRRKPTLDLSTMVYGKVPPQAKELEEAVLGGCMLEKSAIGIVAEVLQPECFYVDSHQRIFKACLSLSKKNIPIDILTIVEELKISEELEIVGGPYAITKMTNAVVSTANIEAHSRIVYQKFLQRELIRISGEIISEAYEDSTDVFDLLDDSANKVNSLSIFKRSKSYRKFNDVAGKVLTQIIEVKDGKEELTGVPTGNRHLDILTQGWQRTNLIVLAARPAVGKSAVAGNLAMGAACSKIKPTGVGVFSLEMSSEQWVQRILSAESEIELYDLKRGRVTDGDLVTLNSIIYLKHPELPIFFDDSSNLDLHQLKAKARLMVSNEGVGLIILDYLQLVEVKKSSNENRDQEISKVSRELKQLAKELNIPIIALSQLSRAGDTKDPQLKHLRESGAIEQDADDVIFLVTAGNDEEEKLADVVDLILKIEKHRNGKVMPVNVKYIKSIQKIMSETEYRDYVNRNDNLHPTQQREESKLVIHKGSKMSSGEFDEGFEANPY